MKISSYPHDYELHGTYCIIISFEQVRESRGLLTGSNISRIGGFNMSCMHSVANLARTAFLVKLIVSTQFPQQTKY